MGSFMQAPDSAFQNLTWSDNFIQVYVPSINPNNRTAGTGRIIVQTAAPASLTDTSLIALDIDYAVTNYGYGDGSYRRYDLENDDNNGGYTFKIHDVLYTANTKPCVDYAFKEWVCKTYVNFKVGGTITNPLSQLNPNSQNIIYLADTTDPVFTSSNVLATTIRHDKQCSSSLEPYSQYMAEVDIAVRDGWLWHFDTTQVSLPPNAYDLTTVLIHELGHAHSIAHCGASVKRMYPHTTIGVAERHLHPSDSLAGISVMGHSSWLGLIGCTNSMIPLLCGLIDIEQDVDNLDISLFPNPTSGILNITFGKPQMKINLDICTVLGKKIFHKEILHAENLHTEPLNLTELHLSSGVYILHIEANGKSYQYKFIYN